MSASIDISHVHSIDNDPLDWHSAKFEPPPMDVPIIARAPMGNLSAHLGRELLGWTAWMTLEEFTGQIQEKLISAQRGRE